MKRYSDARDWRELARMLDERSLEEQAITATDAKRVARGLIDLRARTDTANLREGMLVQSLHGAKVRRAGRTESYPASGIVTATESSTILTWSPIALAYLKIDDASGTDAVGSLWLGTTGRALATKPTSGLIQKVGLRLTYDAGQEKHLCLVMPEPPAITVFTP